jgi:zinc protease
MTGQVPPIYQVGLPTGLRLLGVEYERVPWISITCMVKRGAETDPAGRAGVADWTAEFLTRGTALSGAGISFAPGASPGRVDATP